MYGLSYHCPFVARVRQKYRACGHSYEILYGAHGTETVKKTVQMVPDTA